MEDPLGVCSVLHEGKAVITCPVRFREDWKIASDAASFFFPKTAKWTWLTEVTITDRTGAEAGNIDLVLVSIDGEENVVDFGTVEVQAVYISGNIRKVFDYYMKMGKPGFDMDWSTQKNYPRPDYLSSSRKRLAPQLIYKGGILHSWGKKQVVAVQRPFFKTLPPIPRVSRERAQVAWLIYDLDFDNASNRYSLQLKESVYTEFQPSLDAISKPEAGDVKDFTNTLREKLKEKLKNYPEGSSTGDLREY